MNTIIPKLTLLFLLITISCGSGNVSDTLETKENITDEFSKYWYEGKAELTSYHLEQARYGEIHQGEAVLVFVTEDFSKSKQVKLDDPNKNPKDKVPILKLNLTKKFNTGIYPYSIMQSVFTPVDLKKNPNSLKLTASSQEWCGHTFTQINLNKNQYDLQLFSYFESEGDYQKKIPKVLLEDEIWTMIRIAPERLPKGEIDIIPGLISARLSHQAIASNKAIASMEEKGNENIFTLKYPKINRSLSIRFNKVFPHEIISWEERGYSGFGASRKILTTKATLNKSIKLDYWNKHDVADLHYRKELGLE